MGGKRDYIDKTGKIVSPPRDFLLPFSEGLALFSKGGKWGYVNTTGKVVIPPRFKKALLFSEGLAAVRPGEQEKASKTIGAVRTPSPLPATGGPIAPPIATGQTGVRTTEQSENDQERTRFAEWLGANLLQLLVLIMGVLTGVRGSLAVTGSWTVTGWPARVIGWSFVLAAAGSWTLPGLMVAPGFEPLTTVEVLVLVLVPYWWAATVTVAVLVWAWKHQMPLGASKGH